MIQAGTIRTGSRYTLSVAGTYWMSSISRLRATTLPGVERFRTDRLLPLDNAPLVFPEVHCTTHEVHPTLLKRGFEYLWVCEQKVRGRDNVEDLTRDKRHDVLV